MNQCWPPWFTTAVWGWASRLGWKPEPKGQDKRGGATLLELLANFVVQVKILSPKLVGRPA